MKNFRLLFMFANAISFIVPAKAEILPFNVHLQTTAEDSIGRQLAYQVREKLNKSSTLRLIDDRTKTSIQVKIVTLTPDGDNNNSSKTIYSEVILIKIENENYSRYENSFVGTCGKNVISSCADTIIGDIDKLADDMRSAFEK